MGRVRPGIEMLIAQCKINSPYSIYFVLKVSSLKMDAVQDDDLNDPSIPHGPSLGAPAVRECATNHSTTKRVFLNKAAEVHFHNNQFISTCNA